MSTRRSTAAPRRRARDRDDLGARLDTLDVLIVCGSGGVGKTSIAASIAVSEAMRGRRVCVLTIDPAKRLADAMGLRELEDREKRVTLPAGAAKGGSLHALMLDPKTAFDRLVEETSHSQEQVDRILSNRIYQQVSTGTAGMQEYMALERLYELDRTGKYDLVIVDTPPAAHARDLLDSPRRMLSFLEGRSLRWFLKPSAKVGRFGLKAMGGSNGPVVGVLQRITGAEMLRDTTEFFESMEGIYGTVTERIRVVERMFANPATGFLVVTSPERDSVDQSVDFWSLLEARGYRFVGTVVNRIEPDTGSHGVELEELTALDGISESLAARIAAAQQDHSALAVRDATRLEELAGATGHALTIGVPRQPVLVNDLEGLSTLTPYLYA